MVLLGRPTPRRRSLETLAMLALRATGAGGYALYEADAATGALHRRAGCGSEVLGRNPLEAERELPVLEKLRFPLRTGPRMAGLLEFFIAKDNLTPEKLLILERTSRLVEAVLGGFQEVDTHIQLAAQISELEAELADEKIAERAAGILETGVNLHAMDAIENHIHKVLAARKLRSILDGLLTEFSRRVSERKLTSQAKAFLQARQGLSEEQAYLHLRAASRRNRRPMSEIARQVLDEQNPF